MSRFSTGPNEFYCGSIIGGDLVRRGFESTAKLRMTFDSAKIDRSPGTLTTDNKLLDGAPMVAIPELINDPLWTLEFGEGRDKNLLYVVQPTLPTGGPSLFAVISLLHDSNVEVRLMRGAPPLDGTAPSGQNEQPLFGVFAPMGRNTAACVF